MAKVRTVDPQTGILSDWHEEGETVQQTQQRENELKQNQPVEFMILEKLDSIRTILLWIFWLPIVWGLVLLILMLSEWQPF